MSQAPNETYTPIEQVLMLDIIMNTPPEEVVDIKSLKEHVHESAKGAGR